jgi:hypothetical protein
MHVAGESLRIVWLSCGLKLASHVLEDEDFLIPLKLQLVSKKNFLFPIQELLS